jgi:hypothetical protein
MSDKPRTDWVSFSLGGLWAMEKDGGLLVPKCHPLSSSERAERLISYAAQGLRLLGQKTLALFHQKTGRLAFGP